MSRSVFYNITKFNWHLDKNSFIVEAVDLWPEGDWGIPFPNAKRQFFIINKHTNRFRRFRFNKEFYDLEQRKIWEYISTDGIFCKIFVDLP